MPPLFLNRPLRALNSRLRESLCFAGVSGFAAGVGGVLSQRYGEVAIFAVVWILLAVYTGLLRRWRRAIEPSSDIRLQSLVAVSLVLAIPLAVSLTAKSVSSFAAVWLLSLSAVCRGTDGGESVWRGLALELALCLAPGWMLYLALLRGAPTAFQFGVAIWIFFLLQSLRLLMGESVSSAPSLCPGEAFEQARRRAELLLERS